ncbi:MAG: YfhO family protein [Endomicrobiia bacterium]
MKKISNTITYLILFFLVIIFLNQIVFTNLIYFQRDITLQFKPWKIFINSFLSNFKNSLYYLDFIPLWNHYNHCGAPLMANIQSQVFYPFSIIFIILKDFACAYKIFIIAHFFLSTLFMFLLLREKKLSLISSILGSVIWSFNGFMVSRIEFLSVFSTIIWLPLILYLFSLALKNFQYKKIIFLSIIIAIQFLAGHTQMWFYSMLFFLLYSLFKSYEEKSFLPIKIFSVSILFSLFIVAIQFLPTLEFVLHTTRAGEEIKSFSQFGMKYKETTILGSLNIKDLLNFFYPYYWQFDLTKYPALTNYWLYTFYIGFLATLLTIVGFITNKNIKEKIFYLITFIFVFMFAMGDNSFFYKLIYKTFPLIRIFRFPSTIIYINIFILSLFSSYGVQFFLKSLNQYKRILYFVFFICFLELYIYNTKISMLLPKSILDEKKETINFLIKKNLEYNSNYRFAHTPLTQTLTMAAKGKDLYSGFAKFRDNMLSNINLEYKIPNFRGQDLELKNFFKFMDFVYSRNSLDEAAVFFAIANTKYILSAIKYNTKYWKLKKETNTIKIYENIYVLARLYPVEKIIFEPDLDKSLKIIEKLNLEVIKTAIIHSNEKNIEDFIYSQNNLNQKNSFVIHYSSFVYNKIFAKITNAKPQFLVISQNYYPGWKCFINNKKTKIFHCNIFMSGVYLPQGENYIYLCYDPISFKVGCIITLLSILFVILYLFETKN